MRCAVVDIGSNTIRMNIYDVIQDLSFKLVLTETDNTGILNYINNHIISDEGIFRLIEVLSSFKKISENIPCDKIFYFATASLRLIDNKTDVLIPLRDRLGIEIEMINGESEALLSFEGLKKSFRDKMQNGFMIDMGGGSIELLGFVDGLAVRALSLPVGSLSLYKKFVSNILPDKNELSNIKTYIDRHIVDVCWLKNYGSIAYLVGGTARAASRLYDHIFKNSFSELPSVMTYQELKNLFDYVKKPDNDIIKILISNIPDRLHTFIPGIYTFLRILKFAETRNIIISPTGIREGYLINRLTKEQVSL